MDTANLAAVTKGRLAADLQALGVSPGQTVMLHASVRAIGWVLGGPRVVLETLLDLLSPSGTLMILASWEGNPYRMDRWPAPEQAACLAECPAFDPATSPAAHREMSILAEYLRTWPGAYRSAHPLASFVAAGARADWFTAGQTLHYPHGPESPLARLCAAGGKVVVLGATLSHLTLLHHAEHLADVPHKRIDRYSMPVLQDGRRVWVAIEEYDTTDGIADFGSDDYFLEIGQEYIASGRGRTGEVGSATSYLFDADDLKQFAVRWMEAHYQGPLS